MHITFDKFEAALNVNGNQRVARLQSSILDPKILEDSLQKQVESVEQDHRVPTAPRNHMLLEHEYSQETPGEAQDLDIDLLPGEIRALPYHSLKSRKPAHVFGQVDCIRGSSREADSQDGDEDEGFARKRRRIAGLPVAER